MRYPNPGDTLKALAPAQAKDGRVDWLWVVFIALLPLYVFSSGSLQPAHFLFLVAFLYQIVLSRLRYMPQPKVASAFGAPLLVFGMLVSYIVLVDLFWALRLGSTLPLQFSSYYIFNYLMLIYGYMQCRSSMYRFAWSTVVGVYVSIGIQFTASLIVGVNFDENRQTLFFNNPNQLAFFALSSACIIAVAESRHLGKTWLNLIMLSACAWLVFLTVSKAGIACVLLLLLFSMTRVKLRMAPLAVATALILGLAGVESGFVDHLQTRIENTNNVADNQIEGRGYDRILNYPEYAVLGAGEGESRRFHGVLSDLGIELHSSIGTILFSYGIPGLALYLGFYGILAARARGVERFIIVVPFIFGLTHNGLRFSIAWVFLFFIASCLAEVPFAKRPVRWIGPGWGAPRTHSQPTSAPALSRARPAP